MKANSVLYYPHIEFIDGNRWLHLSKELARGYMFKLSQVVERTRNLNRGVCSFEICLLYI